MTGKILRALTASLLLALAVGTVPGPARAAQDAGPFIQTLADQVLQTLKDTGVPQARKKQLFSALFSQDFDVPSIGRSVLGRYWRIATPAQQSQYLDLFGKYVVAVYSDRFSRYAGGVSFKVVGEQQTVPHVHLVSSIIDRGSGDPPVHVDWSVDDSSGADKIVDVSVENLSMRVTQHDEFASVIETNGGSVDALINLLRQKVQQNGM